MGTGTKCIGQSEMRETGKRGSVGRQGRAAPPLPSDPAALLLYRGRPQRQSRGGGGQEKLPEVGAREFGT